MSSEDEKKLYLLENEDETGDSTEGGTGTGSTGSSSGEVLFHFDTFVERRDDLLSPEEIKRLLIVEKNLHKVITNKQKQLIKERKAAKEGVKLNQANQLGDYFGSYETSIYKTHPISNTAQFSGATDRKVVGVPTLSEMETNTENQNKLMNELKLQNEKKLRLENAPENAPTYRPRPKLTPFG